MSVCSGVCMLRCLSFCFFFPSSSFFMFPAVAFPPSALSVNTVYACMCFSFYFIIYLNAKTCWYSHNHALSRQTHAVHLTHWQIYLTVRPIIEGADSLDLVQINQNMSRQQYREEIITNTPYIRHSQAKPRRCCKCTDKSTRAGNIY